MQLRMNSSNTALVAYAAMLTTGLALMLVGFRWLFFLGLALVLFSSLFSTRRIGHWAPILGVLACVAYAAWVFVEDGTTVSRNPPGPVFSIIFIVAWLLALVLEWSHRRGIREKPNHA